MSGGGKAWQEEEEGKRHLPTCRNKKARFCLPHPLSVSISYLLYLSLIIYLSSLIIISHLSFSPLLSPLSSQIMEWFLDCLTCKKKTWSDFGGSGAGNSWKLTRLEKKSFLPT